MKVKQIANILNTVYNAMQIGTSDVLETSTTTVYDDLSNIVDVGKQVLSFLDSGGVGVNYDNYLSKLIDQIGKITFVDRAYTSQAPNILKDSWEYGSIMMKVRAEIPEARDNDTWNLSRFGLPTSETTENGAGLGENSYPDPFVLSKPNVEARFFNSKVTYEVPITLASYQLKEAFQSASQMSRFFSMIENRIRVKKTLCTDALIMATIRNLIANKVGSGNAVNLLALYNTGRKTPLSATDARKDPDFLRFAAKTIMLYKRYLAEASVLYNEGNYVTYTPADRLKAIFLSEFAKDLEVYLYSTTFHNEFLQLDGYSEVGYWEGSGDSAADGFSQRSKISSKYIKMDGTVDTVTQDGIIAVLFDEEAAAVCNENDRVTSIYNPRGEYTNFFYKWDAAYLNDMQENVVVFYIGETSSKKPSETTPKTTA